MLNSKRENLSGWGNFPVEECITYRPEKRRDLGALLREHQGPLLARGLGRSYGDAALAPGGVVRTERLDHWINFDEEQGVVRAQAGVSLAEVMALTIPRGLMPPVLPGTRFASLGGALACNVHGKNQWKDGDFAEHVTSARVRLAGGESVECSPESNGELFWATAGGMGMTGIIEEVALKLKPIPSSSLSTLTYRVNSIEDMVAAFEHYKNGSDYMVGWIDHMGRGRHLGRGVFEAASHISVEEGGEPNRRYAPLRTRISVPLFMPSFLLNRISMALYNKWRFRRYSDERKSDIVDFNGFFHPLDGIGNWNRLYGRRGFFQYQFVLPETGEVGRQLRSCLAVLQQQKLFSFLAVIKYHRDGKGLIPFSRTGYSLALDFPNTRRVRAMLPRLDKLIAEYGGRVYLAKDALLTPELFNKMYGEPAGRWREALNKFDPQGRFASLMCERLQWKPER